MKLTKIADIRGEEEEYRFLQEKNRFLLGFDGIRTDFVFKNIYSDLLGDVYTLPEEYKTPMNEDEYDILKYIKGFNQYISKLYFTENSYFTGPLRDELEFFPWIRKIKKVLVPKNQSYGFVHMFIYFHFISYILVNNKISDYLINDLYNYSYSIVRRQFIEYIYSHGRWKGLKNVIEYFVEIEKDPFSLQTQCAKFVALKTPQWDSTLLPKRIRKLLSELKRSHEI